MYLHGPCKQNNDSFRSYGVLKNLYKCENRTDKKEYQISEQKKYSILKNLCEANVRSVLVKVIWILRSDFSRDLKES